MASSSALVVPLVFHFLGTRVWEIGQRLGCLTQAQFFRARWQSDVVASVLFVFLLVLLIPYLLIGIMGAGITLHQVTQGVLAEWLGSLIVCSVVFAYVVTSGLRGTSWANCFQTLVFLSLGLITFFYISGRLGGLNTAMQQVQQTHPQLLVIAGGVSGLELFSYLFIPLSAAMFPHLLHALAVGPGFGCLSAARGGLSCVYCHPLGTRRPAGDHGPHPLPRSAGSSRQLGAGAHDFSNYSPEVLAGLLAAGVLAAIMSSLDSQVLSVGTIFTQDVVKHFGFHDEMDERRQVLSGRLFVTLILAGCFFLSLITNRSIFSLGDLVLYRLQLPAAGPDSSALLEKKYQVGSPCFDPRDSAAVDRLLLAGMAAARLLNRREWSLAPRRHGRGLLMCDDSGVTAHFPSGGSRLEVVLSGESGRKGVEEAVRRGLVKTCDGINPCPESPRPAQGI